MYNSVDLVYLLNFSGEVGMSRKLRHNPKEVTVLFTGVSNSTCGQRVSQL